MSFSKATLRAAGLILGTICLHGCGPDPRTRFGSEVEGMIFLANEGKHTELVDRISKPLQKKLRQEGWAALAALANATTLGTTRIDSITINKSNDAFVTVDISATGYPNVS